MTSTSETLRLRRGVGVLPRGNGLLQVGHDPSRRVLLPDTPSIAGFLHDLAAGVDPPQAPELEQVVATLRSNGLVVDAGDRRRRHRARSRTSVEVLGPDPWRRELTLLLVEAGLGLPGLSPPSQDGTTADGVTVLLSAGEPDREYVDALTHAGDPVLFLSVVDARVRLGPFVLPGVTACLRCVDAHLAAVDPWHTGALPAAARGEFPLDLPPLLMRLALVRAAGDIAVWAEGRRPQTWSATTWLGEDLDAEHETWTRHPHCGCSWGDSLLTR
ncbi:hypothetical protein [Nocardioides houyundeii]|uniref:hypothetical protein n=1 Tax=Nocardioides houyundeii TaxID=2045452 RepID=UPI0013B3BC7A|nr:hypothetical protein [Nocardioides houyundeii]